MKLFSLTFGIVAFMAAILVGVPVFGQNEDRQEPDKEDIEVYKSFTADQKVRFRDFIKETLAATPEMSREERGDIIRAAMKSIAKGEEPGFKPAQPKPPETIDLWRNEMPGPAPEVYGDERDTTSADSKLIAGKPVVRLGHVSTPQIEIFWPPAHKANGAAVVVCPGGGFYILAQDLEGTEVAQWLNEQGITAVVLKYRVPTAPHGNELVAGPGNSKFKIPKKALGPVMDAQRALAFVHSNAEAWNLEPDKIGVMGFSAGGQTAVLAALADGISTYEKTDEVDESFCGASFAMAIYPGGLVDEKTGELHAFAQPNAISPPMFFAHAGNDRVTCMSSVAMFAALKKAGVPSELHIYETGGHGYGMRPTEESVTKWPILARQWLENRGVVEDTSLDSQH